MRLGDLMIGDWIYYIDDNGNRIPVQVKENHCDEVLLSNGETVCDEYIAPIAITLELLELNNVPYEFYDGYCFDFYNKPEGHACSVSGIWHVHELQQAMRSGGFRTWANEFKIE